MVKLLVLGLIVLGSFFAAVAALLIKKGAKGNLFLIWKKKLFWYGFLLYVSSTLIYLFVLRVEALNIVFPLSSLSYLFATALSVKFLGERMNKWKWFGLLGIVIGVIFLGLGS